MTTGATTKRAIRQNLPSHHHAGLPSWIPAFAGMTTRREQVGCHLDSPSAMPTECLTVAPSVIYGQEVLYAARGHACMDAGGRAASGTGRRGCPEPPGAGPPAWMHACMDAGGRAASGTSGRGGRAVSGTKAEESSGLHNHSRKAETTILNTRAGQTGPCRCARWSRLRRWPPPYPGWYPWTVCPVAAPARSAPSGMP